MHRIWKYLLICLFIISQAFNAAAGDLSFKLLNSSKKEVEVGSNLNVFVSVSNQSATARDFRIQINGKGDHFRMISDFSSLKIEKKTSFNKIVSLHVSGNLASADYTLELEAIDNKTGESFGKAALPVFVLPKYEIEVIKLKSPQYLFSGDTASFFYSIQNLSNLDISVKTTLIDGSQSKDASFRLSKDSTLTSSYKIKLPRESREYTRQSVILIAEIGEKQESSRSVSYNYDVFPSDQQRFDKYNRFPVNFSIIGAMSNRLGGNQYSEMYDIQGAKAFGKSNQNILDFHFRGPDRSGNPLFGMNDEYYLKFQSTHFDIALGNSSFTLSELTESSRSGMGAEFTLKAKKLSIGGFYNKPRYYPLITDIVAGFSNLTFNTSNDINIGFLLKKDTLNQIKKLYTISGNNGINNWLHTSYEIAVSPLGKRMPKAYKGSLSLRKAFFSYSALYTKAEPEFAGFITNSKRMSHSLGLTFSKFNISVNYSENNSNLALDTLYANAPQSINYGFNTNIKLSAKNSISIGAFVLSLKDKAPKPLFDYTRVNGRVSLNNRWGKLTLNLQGDAGQMENRLSLDGKPKKSVFYTSTSTSNYQFNKTFSASAFATYEGGKELITGFDRVYYGGTLNSNLRNKLLLSLQYNSNYEWRFYNTDRSLCAFTMTGRINDQNELSIGANYNLVKNTLDKKEYNIQMRYVHTMNVPVSKKKDVGSLEGQIINKGVDKVGGIRVSVNGIVTITDKEGKFRFSALPVGTYTIGMDASNFGLNATTEIPGPFLVTITPGKVTRFELGMTKSAKITGKLTIQEDEKTAQKGYIGVKEQINKLIIEASSENEMFRIMSENSSFVFSDLRPGKWQIKVYPNGLPQGYQILTSTFNLSLTSGKTEQVEVLIKKQARQVKFQKSTK